MKGLGIARSGSLDAELGDRAAADRPTCFLHVPKSGGESIHAALRAALPEGSLAAQRLDRTGIRIFVELPGPNEFDGSDYKVLALTSDDIKSMAGRRAVSGHFSLGTLQQITHPSRIATIFREPRARLLSLYSFFRAPGVRDFWSPFGSGLLSGTERPLHEFLSDPVYARATDNQVSRMLLDGDVRIPDADFIAEVDRTPLAELAQRRVDSLGFVGILETGDMVWEGFSQIFGVELRQVEINVTGAPEIGAGPTPTPASDPQAALRSFERRTEVDRILYENALARTCGSHAQARRFADRAFARQVERFNRITDGAAADLAVALADS